MDTHNITPAAKARLLAITLSSFLILNKIGSIPSIVANPAIVERRNPIPTCPIVITIKVYEKREKNRIKQAKYFHFLEGIIRNKSEKKVHPINANLKFANFMTRH